MSDDHCSMDWTKVHDFVVEKSNKLLEGINMNVTDVDWFLRDSNVNLQGQPPSAPKPCADEKAPVTRQLLNGLLHTPPSPHLTVLNTNQNSVTKTKPAVSTILEEEAHPGPIQDFSRGRSQPRRRSSASSVNSGSSNTSSGSAGGFLSKIKNKLHRTDSGASASLSPVASRQSGGAVPMDKSLFNSDYQLRVDLSKLLARPSESPTQTRRGSEACGPIPKNPTDSDPRLTEYVRFYQQANKPEQGRRRSSLKADSAACAAAAAVQNTQKPVVEAPSSFKFSSLLKRLNSTNGSNADTLTANKKSFESSVSLNSNASSETVLPEFKDLKPLKRVAFHSLTFLIDPPQQIPSRTPRIGNVEILQGGVVRVNPLTEADKAAIEKSLRGQGGGMVVGGTGALGLIHKDPDHPEYEEHHESEVEPTSGGKDRDGEEDTKIDQHAKKLGIDKPMLHHVARPYSAPVKKMALDIMYTRCCHLREILPIPAIAKQIPEGSLAPLPLLQLRNPTPTMIEIQTFADFIRIAPIICISLDGVSLSYEQFKILLSAMCAKKNLEKLSLRNTPIDAEGWSLLCWFLSRNKALNRLDVTQCPPLVVDVLKKKRVKSDKRAEEENLTRMTCNNENRSDMDWSLFTASIMARDGIEELILTGCCITDLAAFEKLMKHAVALRTYKLGLAYNQLSPQQLRIVFEHWVFTGMSRGLDLGYNDFLSAAYLNVFFEFFKNPKHVEALSNSKLGFLSMNATNLRFSDLFKEVFESCIVKLPNLRYLDMSNNPKLFGTYKTVPSKNPTSSKPPSMSNSPSDTSVRSELSGTESVELDSKPRYSPDAITAYFCSKFPMFKSLVRLHLENNSLTSNSLKALFEIIPYCKNVAYLSIVGNTLEVQAAASLVQCLKNSPSLVTVDVDYLELPELLREQIGLYSMRNLENFVERGWNNNKKSPKEPSLTETLNSFLLRKAEAKLDLNSPEVAEFLERVKRYIKKLRTTISDLFHLQYKNELNIEGKEALIRLLFVDASLERGLKLIDPSLVQNVDGFTPTDILNLHLAEDEKNKSKTSALSKAQGELSHQDFLSPVQSDSLPISRTQSLTNLNSLNKEEGSALKLLQLSKDPELLNKLATYSGDDIRQKLLNGNLSDLDVVIDYMNRSKESGLSLKQIFDNKIMSEKSENVLDEIRQTIDNLRQSLPQKDGQTNGTAQSQTPDVVVPETTRTNEGHNQDMDKALDEILSTYQK